MTPHQQALYSAVEAQLSRLRLETDFSYITANVLSASGYVQMSDVARPLCNSSSQLEGLMVGITLGVLAQRSLTEAAELERMVGV